MNRTAFVIGAISKETGQLVSVDVFSEETPTMSMRLHPVTILREYGETYEAALASLRTRLRRPEWQWLVPLLGERARRGLWFV